MKKVFGAVLIISILFLFAGNVFAQDNKKNVDFSTLPEGVQVYMQKFFDVEKESLPDNEKRIKQQRIVNEAIKNLPKEQGEIFVDLELTAHYLMPFVQDMSAAKTKADCEKIANKYPPFAFSLTDFGFTPERKARQIESFMMEVFLNMYEDSLVMNAYKHIVVYTELSKHFNPGNKSLKTKPQVERAPLSGTDPLVLAEQNTPSYEDFVKLVLEMKLTCSAFQYEEDSLVPYDINSEKAKLSKDQKQIVNKIKEFSF